MLKLRILIVVVCLMSAMGILNGCSSSVNEIKDGYYMAEAVDFDEHGWREYVLVYISKGKIINVEYDAFNRSGFAKSWDLDYMRVMNLADGTYPNEFSRIYTVSLINWQNPDGVDAVAGATHSHVSFRLLAAAAIEQARTGNKQVALVNLHE